MRIALVTSDSKRGGGVGSHLKNLTRLLREKGNEVFTLDVHVGHTPFDDKGFRVQEMMQKIRSRNPHLIHFHGETQSELEQHLLSEYPCLKSYHVYDFCPSGTKYHFLTRRACIHPTGGMCVPRMVYKRCTLTRNPLVILKQYERAKTVLEKGSHYLHVIVYSQFVMEQAIHSGLSRESIKVLPYFIYPSLNERGTPRSLKTLLFAGRLVPEKGVDHLIRAVSEISLDYKLLIAGDGPELQRLKRLASTLNVSEKVSFLGWRNPEQMSELYRRASVLVIPSLWPEPSGLAGIEAMNHGLPVIAYRTGGIPEWNADGRTGFLVENGDTRGLAEKIKELLSNPSLAKDLGLQGKAVVDNGFSPENHYRRLYPIYEDTIETHKRKTA